MHAFVIDPQARTFALPQEGDAHRRTLAVALRVWHEPLWAGYASGGPATGGALIGNSGLINATTHLQGVERAAQAFGQEDDIKVLTLTLDSADWTPALLLPSVEDAAEVYWNGQLVGSVGKVPPNPSWYFRPTPTVIPLGEPRSGVLAIRAWKTPHAFLSAPDEGGLLATPMVGSLEAINGIVDRAAYSYLRAHLFFLIEESISVLVGLFALFTWLRDRRRRMLGWLALAMVFPLYRAL